MVDNRVVQNRPAISFTILLKDFREYVHDSTDSSSQPCRTERKRRPVGFALGYLSSFRPWASMIRLLLNGTIRVFASSRTANQPREYSYQKT